MERLEAYTIHVLPSIRARYPQGHVKVLSGAVWGGWWPAGRLPCIASLARVRAAAARELAPKEELREASPSPPALPVRGRGAGGEGWAALDRLI